MNNTAAEFAAIAVTLYAAHQVADHWIQTDHQAATKGQTGWSGRVSCALHVLTYTATALAALLLMALVTGWTPKAVPLTLGLLISAITHYIADRRTPLARIAAWSGHAGFFNLGRPRPGKDDNPTLGTGAYAMDQSWHYGWLFISALVVAA
jgi:hypothetical protein